jgi:hypothetical protein
MVRLGGPKKSKGSRKREPKPLEKHHMYCKVLGWEHSTNKGPRMKHLLLFQNVPEP